MLTGASGVVPAKSANSSGQWQASDTGFPRPEAPTTHTVSPVQAGMTGSHGRWALRGRPAAPSASIST